MSDVKMVKRLLVGASVSVLASMLMSSAALAEDDAAADEGSVSIVVEDTLVDPVAEEVSITLETEVDPELGDPICIECSGEGPDVSIDPIELDGEVIAEEERQNAVPVMATTMDKGSDTAIKPREDRDTTRAARSAQSGETPRWLKKLFKIK